MNAERLATELYWGGARRLQYAQLLLDLREALRMALDWTCDEEDDDAITIGEFEKRWGENSADREVFRGSLKALLARADEILGKA